MRWLSEVTRKWPARSAFVGTNPWSWRSIYGLHKTHCQASDESWPNCNRRRLRPASGSRIGRASENLLGQVRAFRRQRTGEVCECLALPFVQPGQNLIGEDISAPSILDGGVHIPFPRWAILNPIQKARLVVPRNCATTLLHKLLIRPGLGKSPHILKVTPAEILHAGKCRSQVSGQPVNDLCPPSLRLLPRQNAPTTVRACSMVAPTSCGK